MANAKFKLGDKVTVTFPGEKSFDGTVTADSWETSSGWAYKVRDDQQHPFVVNESLLSTPGAVKPSKPAKAEEKPV